jgi:hypothetical protein
MVDRINSSFEPKVLLSKLLKLSVNRMNIVNDLSGC